VAHQQAEQHLRVAAGLKVFAALAQHRRQRAEIVDFPIIDQRMPVPREGLVGAGIKVEDCQAPMAEADMRSAGIG
jgi:hypothetical protein